MLFQTPEFALLLGVTMVLFHLNRGRGRVKVLLISSFLFYARSGYLDTALFILVVVATFVFAKKLTGPEARPALIGILALLFINLLVFKYGAFLNDNVAYLLRLLGVTLSPPLPRSWLPLGISFYTFQLAAYTIDVYRGAMAPSEDLLEFAAYIMFFGQLVAGPIMRAKELLGQFRGDLAVSSDDWREGSYLIIRGLAKKLIVADWLSGLVVPLFENPYLLNHASVWVAGYLFAFQIYMDFSGYTDIGIGLGRLFGLRLSVNFRSPYLANNPTEFWRRWHITLSSWLRDYLYIPLGGNRKGIARSYINIVITMLLGGLWHGAAWTFVLWGAYQGGLLVAHRTWKGSLKAGFSIPHPLGILFNFQAMALGWMAFRAKSLGDLLYLWAKALDFRQLGTWGGQIPALIVILGLYALHIAERYTDDHRGDLANKWSMFPAPIRGLVYTLVLLLVILSFRPAQPFIYFRF